MPVSQSISQQQQRWIGAGHKNTALPTADDLRRAGEMRHEAKLACSCLSRCQVPCVCQCAWVSRGRVLADCLDSGCTLVAFCGLLRGMGTSPEVADQGGPHHLLDNSILAMWDGLSWVVTLSGSFAHC